MGAPLPPAGWSRRWILELALPVIAGVAVAAPIGAFALERTPYVQTDSGYAAPREGTLTGASRRSAPALAAPGRHLRDDDPAAGARSTRADDRARGTLVVSRRPYAAVSPTVP